ncbi:hypothetical protein VKT23_009953 [Stygiomarasmius scandens]|uniref:Uncharacterized protein n=1 Tax=Marasmiellus scandens TaxID=2682957 RepID=A0ABR1JFC9_9AGAR
MSDTATQAVHEQIAVILMQFPLATLRALVPNAQSALSRQELMNTPSVPSVTPLQAAQSLLAALSGQATPNGDKVDFGKQVTSSIG